MPRLIPSNKGKEQHMSITQSQKTNLLYCGIGFSGNNEIDGVEVASIVKNSPAEKAGLQVGDYITQKKENYAGAEWENMGKYLPYSTTVGTPGSQVMLKVQQGGRGGTEVETGWITRSEITVFPDLPVTKHDTASCGLLGSLTPTPEPILPNQLSTYQTL